VLGTISSTPATVKTPDGKIINVPAADRLSQGTTNATQQVSNPVGLNLSTVARSATNQPITATPKQGL